MDHDFMGLEGQTVPHMDDNFLNLGNVAIC